MRRHVSLQKPRLIESPPRHDVSVTKLTPTDSLQFLVKPESKNTFHSLRRVERFSYNSGDVT